MPSLKDVKMKIVGVGKTKQITKAMKLVASAKLHRAQAAIESMLPYEKKLNSMLAGFLTSGVQVDSTLAREREVPPGARRTVAQGGGQRPSLAGRA